MCSAVLAKISLTSMPWNDNARGLLAERLLEGIQEASAAISSDGKVSNALVAIQETRSRSVSSGPVVARPNLLLSTGPQDEEGGQTLHAGA